MWVFHKQRSITYIISHLIDETLSVTEIWNLGHIFLSKKGHIYLYIYLGTASKRQNNLEEPNYRAWTLHEAATVESADGTLLKEQAFTFWW